MKKLFLCLMLLLALSAQARMGRPEIQGLFFRIAQNFSSIDISLEVVSKETPGAFAKWKKRNISGVITLTTPLLEMAQFGHDEAALILCHEFGHFFGGSPYVMAPKPQGIHAFRNPFENLSVEGQADYFATKECLKYLWPKENSRIEKSIENVAIIYQEINNDFFQLFEDFSIHESSQGKVQETLSRPGVYPSLQCRVDTMLAGLFDQLRPQCWFYRE